MSLPFFFFHKRLDKIIKLGYDLSMNKININKMEDKKMDRKREVKEIVIGVRIDQLKKELKNKLRERVIIKKEVDELVSKKTEILENEFDLSRMAEWSESEIDVFVDRDMEISEQIGLEKRYMVLSRLEAEIMDKGLEMMSLLAQLYKDKKTAEYIKDIKNDVSRLIYKEDIIKLIEKAINGGQR